MLLVVFAFGYVMRHKVIKTTTNLLKLEENQNLKKKNIYIIEKLSGVSIS